MRRIPVHLAVSDRILKRVTSLEAWRKGRKAGRRDKSLRGNKRMDGRILKHGA